MSNNGDKELKIFELINKGTGEKHFSVSDNAQDACKQADWLIGDCFVRELKPELRPRKNDPAALMVKIPCLTCPFQYAECRKPATNECPTRPSAPELQNWLKQAAESHLCDYIGQGLSIVDYQLRLKWCPVEQAIVELAHRS